MRQFPLGAPELILILLIVFFLFGRRLFDATTRFDLRKLGLGFYAVLALLFALFGLAEFMIYWHRS